VSWAKRARSSVVGLIPSSQLIVFHREDVTDLSPKKYDASPKRRCSGSNTPFALLTICGTY